MDENVIIKFHILIFYSLHKEQIKTSKRQKKYKRNNITKHNKMSLQ